MYFTFMEESTETILSTPLLLCSFDRLDDITGSNREVQKGETGIYRSTANEYGAKYSDVLTFDYALAKNDGTAFTNDEQITVEKWLTSPKLAQYLCLYDQHNDIRAMYCGTFISTQWKTFTGGWCGILFSFQANSPYALQKHKLNFTGISDTQTLDFTIYSDESEEYVYPSLRFYAARSTSGKIPTTVKNLTDDDNELNIQLYNKLPIYMDCKTARLTDGTTSGVVDFADIGWQDYGNIYLPRFLAGENQLEITVDTGATLDLDITYMSPKKIVGGWLDYD